MRIFKFFNILKRFYSADAVPHSQEARVTITNSNNNNDNSSGGGDDDMI